MKKKIKKYVKFAVDLFVVYCIGFAVGEHFGLEFCCGIAVGLCILGLLDEYVISQSKIQQSIIEKQKSLIKTQQDIIDKVIEKIKATKG